MDKTVVFSKYPIACLTKSSFDAGREPFGRGYRYELSPCTTEYLNDTLDFIFEGLVRNMSGERLRAGGVTGEQVSEFFSQKLAAYLYITGIRHKIDNIIRPLLEESNVINIEGLINFRLREFAQDISAFFDMLFYEYKVQKQYDDFVSLVRNYIELENPKESVVHIVFKKNGFMLYNAKKTNITYQALRKYENDQGFTEGSLNDFLISSLLYFLPESIVLHIEDKFLSGARGAANNRIIETIKAIFKERVACCEMDGCELCAGEPAFEPFTGYMCDDISFT